ncbi:diguanylate cyclase/phosphodiesterase with PAS/PAC sensor(s) [Cellulomonas flavigena DSM 20109]|uniref:Diguanylate cyclase/phosphodiesterase with PAS/PAC sensor(S) n=1 Tax=Cellulomonas flavigena (strain ATCC 482 / DSM 20109 / BCRC 11376 / JCM 18109 / NBRC 3775 / NCIMB 8073 / NRS 134) TaxID=446466 RepID=D5UD96_CELFN|nr:EAL domain-containing protein [Cellulomonas flavigena]ADG74433.1 diguanylate cyclase/phosphodiesterase with PAS/PAC sensor(s) [Cellulomonas flavigena DSM 20109]
MSSGLVGPYSVVTTVIAVVAVAALGTVLVLLRRERVQARRNVDLVRVARQLHKRYDALQLVTSEGVVVQSRDGTVLDLSERAAQILGVTRESVVGAPVGRMPVVLLDDRGLAVNPGLVLGRHDTDPEERTTVVTLVPPGPGVRPSVVQVTSRVMPPDEDGETSVLTTVVDITARHDVEVALSRSETQFKVAMENAPIGMALVDLQWRISEANVALAELLGTHASALRGYRIDELSAPEDRAAQRMEMDKLLGGGQQRFSLEMRCRRADDQLVWVVLDAALVRAGDGAPDHFVVQVRDATESKMQAEMLTHRAMHDPLTGLANRTLLQEVLQTALAQPGAVDRIAVLACDLDGFKGINDRYGHAAGDDILVHVAGVLRAASAGSGTVARLGGDEFVVVVQDVHAAKAVFEVANEIHSGLAEPVRVGRRRLGVAASVGIALAEPHLVEAGAPTLLAAADAALYRAKQSGRGRTEVYDTSMELAAPSNVHRELLHAITTGEIVVHYQPIVDLSDSRVVGYEALVRWQHPHRGLLLPGAFLPQVQEAGVSVMLGQLVASRVVEFLATNAHDGRWVSVNVSADQLGDSELATRLLQDLSRHRVTAGRLVLELTESSLVASGTRIRHELTQLSAAGVPILLDDFGTGVSPLSYLRDLPVAGVKLDMSFTSGIPHDPTAGKVVRALGALARELAMVTIAEGIENEEQADFLRRNGWRYGQGWLYGGALPME